MEEQPPISFDSIELFQTSRRIWTFSIYTPGDLSESIYKKVCCSFCLTSTPIKIDGTLIDEKNFSEMIESKPNYFNIVKRCNSRSKSALTSKEMLKSLKNYFENSQDNGYGSDSFLLNLSGVGNENAQFYINIEKDQFISYQDIAQLWIGRKSKSFQKSEHLLIIIDASYSGSWVKANQKSYHWASHFGISVLSSCDADKPSFNDLNYGGSLIYGLYTMNKDQSNLSLFKKYLSQLEYKPHYTGFYLDDLRNYRLFLFLDSDWTTVNDLRKKVQERNDKLNVFFCDSSIKKVIGIEHYWNGNRYEGQFLDENPSGKGKYYWANGNRYEGNFVNSKQSGQGVYFWTNGDRYEGEFADNLLSGKGKYFWANGDRYEGGFIENKQTGKGKLFCINGDIYKGDFVDSRQTGVGLFVSSNGEKYIGNFLNDKFEGKGIYYWPNGDRYEGNFVGGLRSGKGAMIFNDGGKTEGEFLDGNLIS